MFSEADLRLTAKFSDIWSSHIGGREGLDPSLYTSQDWALSLCTGQDLSCQPGPRQVHLPGETA